MTASGFVRKQLPSGPTVGSDPKSGSSEPSVLGRVLFARISAVEGIVLDEEALEAFAEFDRKGLSAEERRREIIARFRREAAE